MPITKRPGAAAPPKVTYETVSFGSLADYSGGFTLPEGAYCLFFNIVLRQPTDKAPKIQERLGVALDAYPLHIADDGTATAAGEKLEQFLSLGTKAKNSFMPHPDNPKQLVKIPEGAGQPLNNKTNFFLFLDSLYNCGMPEGIFTDDFSVIDGIHVRTGLILEPEERKGFGSAATGEVEEERKGGKVPVVVEILESGKPWDGTGGVPEDKPKAPAKVVGKIAAKPAAAPAPKAGPKATPPKAAPPAVVEEATEGEEDESVKIAAINGVSAVLGEPKYANACPKLVLKTATHKAVKEAEGDEMATAVINTYFGTDDDLNALLAEVNYAVTGNQIKPVA